jgi:UPF0755 protein
LKKIISVLGLLVVLGFISVFLYFQRSWSQEIILNEEVVLEIPPGAGASAIAKILFENKLISSSLHFKIFLRYHGLEKNMKSGIYLFSENTSMKKIAGTLVAGKTATKRVTIREGLFSWEIFSVLKRAFPNLDSLKWQEKIDDEEWASMLNLKAQSLEGYLFPSTYLFPYRVDEKMIQEIMVKQFFKTIDELGMENSEIYHQLGLHKVITLASIVEEESAVAHERKRIAGVFHNRLRVNMPLGADPTVRYIFKNRSGPIYKSQLASNNPYNTRKHAGLPPGPISNPGREAILATLYPEKNDLFFFVAKDDGSREHFFGKNLAEHNRYREVAAANRQRRSELRILDNHIE